jgi:hypothetical protein
MARLINTTVFFKNVVKFIDSNADIISIEESKDKKRKEYIIKTKCDKLPVTIIDRKSEIYTVFTCFDNVDKAKDKFDCNPFSGKYNFHLSQFGKNKKESDEIAFNEFKAWFKQIIA